MKKRCEWAGSKNPLMAAYHDKEWGKPVKNDRKLFEFLILEGAQAGLSWETILNRRENYRKIFHQFDPEKLVRLTDNQLETILKNPGIIRNRLKVYSVRINARAYFEIRKEFGTFGKYLWSFVGGKPIINKWKKLSEIPANTPESDAMCKDLKKRGFKFVGSTICYAFMQATGMVNDHTIDCFRYTIK
ncbi:MAG: DNA-3-methyladenine glycosylase I [Nitrospinaceae bacterium]